jgi:hypothetical protein
MPNVLSALGERAPFTSIRAPRFPLSAEKPSSTAPEPCPKRAAPLRSLSGGRPMDFPGRTGRLLSPMDGRAPALPWPGRFHLCPAARESAVRLADGDSPAEVVPGGNLGDQTPVILPHRIFLKGVIESLETGYLQESEGMLRGKPGAIAQTQPATPAADDPGGPHNSFAGHRLRDRQPSALERPCPNHANGPCCGLHRTPLLSNYPPWENLCDASASPFSISSPRAPALHPGNG